jgi:sugar lactone lactonase YvrE
MPSKSSSMPALQPRNLMTGLTFGESPRWHDDRLWVADWGTHEILSVDLNGQRKDIVRLPAPSFQAICFDWLPDGGLVIVSSREALLLRRESEGALITYADLRKISDRGWNEVVVDGRGNTYVNGGGFDFAAGEKFAPGVVALVRPDGTARQVADGIAFPNGMAVTPDNSTLIVAESYAKKLTAFNIAADGSLSNRRVWADVGDDHPDGICLDAEGAVWYADVGNKRCSRVREGGEVLQRVDLDLGCFACMLGGADGRTLFMVAREWRGVESMADTARRGQVLTLKVPVPHAGRP